MFCCFFFVFSLGIGSGELSKAHSLRSAQFSVRQDTSPRFDSIGVRGDLVWGPRPSTSHNEVRNQRVSSLIDNTDKTRGVKTPHATRKYQRYRKINVIYLEIFENFENSEFFEIFENLEFFENFENLEFLENFENLEFFENFENLEFFENFENLEFFENFENLEFFEIFGFSKFSKFLEFSKFSK